MTGNDDSFGSLEDRALKIFQNGKREGENYKSGVQEHLKAITDPKERAREALSLFTAFHHGQSIQSELREQSEGHFKDLYRKTLGYIEKNHKTGLHAEVTEEDFAARKKRAEQIIADVMRPAAEEAEGKQASKVYFQDLDGAGLDDIRAHKIKLKRKQLYSELVGDEKGEAYDQLLTALMSSKDLSHEIRHKEGVLNDVVRKLAGQYAGVGKEIYLLRKNMSDLYEEPGSVQSIGVPHVNDIMKSINHKYVFDEKSITKLPELQGLIQEYAKAGPEQIERQEKAKATKHSILKKAANDNEPHRKAA